jgi:hypothetical protein
MKLDGIAQAISEPNEMPTKRLISLGIGNCGAARVVRRWTALFEFEQQNVADVCPVFGEFPGG